MEKRPKKPTYCQLQEFAKAVYLPLGYLLLDEPPKEELPVTDFRTLPDAQRSPSANLLATIYDVQNRQEWIKEY